MIAKIIPYGKFPQKISFFDYKIPINLEKSLKIGDLVSIPFRNSSKIGIVYSIINSSQQQTPYKLKKLNGFALNTEISFSTYYPLFIEKIADYYFNSSSTILYHAWPKPITKKYKIIPKITISENDNNIKINKNDLIKINTLITQIKNQKQIINYYDINKKLFLYIKLIQESLANNKQIIFIFPLIKDVNLFYNLIENKFPEKITKIHSKLSKTKVWNSFLEISNNKPIIIGTKLALFAPLKNINYIVIDNYEDKLYKQTDQNPRYHALKIVDILSNFIPKTKMIYTSNKPLIKDIYYKTPILFLDKHTNPDINLVDMNAELKEKHNYALSFPLQTKIERALENNKKIILFCNKKGSLKTIICKECKYIVVCPKCKTNLGANTKQIKCPQCDFILPALDICPRCQSSNIQHIGFGTSRIFSIAKKSYPNAKIIKIDSDKNLLENNDLIENNDIIICTQYFFDNLQKFTLPNLGLLGIITIDHLLNKPNFNNNNETLNLLLKLYSFAYTNKTQTLMQTFYPDNFIIQTFLNLNLKNFYKQEIEQRKSFNYPPFTQLITLINKNKIEKKGYKESYNLYKKLINTLNTKNILGPFKHPKQNLFFKHGIIIKTKTPTELNEIKTILEPELNKNWIIDIDPINVLPIQ